MVSAWLFQSAASSAQETTRLLHQKSEPLPARDRDLPRRIGANSDDKTLLHSMTHDVKPFGKTSDGQDVKLHTLRNTSGMIVRLIDYGATMISVEVPDRAGKNAN